MPLKHNSVRSWEHLRLWRYCCIVEYCIDIMVGHTSDQRKGQPVIGWTLSPATVTTVAMPDGYVVVCCNIILKTREDTVVERDGVWIGFYRKKWLKSERCIIHGSKRAKGGFFPDSALPDLLHHCRPALHQQKEPFRWALEIFWKFKVHEIP